MKKRIGLTAIMVFIFAVFLVFEAKGEIAIKDIPEYQMLFDKFKNKGFTKEEISKIFSDNRFVVYPQILVKGKRINYFDPEYKLFTRQSIARGEKALRQREKILRQVEERFGVEKEILIGIFRIETDLGEGELKYRVLGSLATQILFKNRRAEFFGKELSCFIGLGKEKQWDILAIKGSSAGAFGLFQFIPTSYLNYAIDGNGDGKVNLFVFEDAVFSAANYLMVNGWKKGDAARIKKALFSYNRDNDYVRAVLAYANALK